MLALAVEILESRPGPHRGSLLDLGAGDGHMAPVFEHLGYRVTCVDIDPAAVTKASRRPATSVVNADAQHLPFASGSFDAIYSNSVFQYVDRAAALAEVCRVLRPGGTLVAVENLYGSPFARLVRAYVRLKGFRYAPHQEPRRHLRRGEISLYESRFGAVQSRVYNLLTAAPGTLLTRFMPAAAIPALTRALGPVHGLDRLCLRAIPALEHLAWHIVIWGRR
jgi:2-polyprenyl-6-hydroxyphenyl methylase/3-demethylubiquinone-9 3-methyltransferase